MAEAAEALANYDPLNEQHVREAFLQAIAPESSRAQALVEAFKRAPEAVEDETTAASMTDFAKQFGTCAKAIEAKRKDHKGRYDICGAIIQTAAKSFIDDLTKLKRQCETRLTDYQRRIAEAERKRREEEFVKAQEEAAKRAAEMETETDLAQAEAAEEAARRAEREAQAKPADLTKSRGEYGSVASLRSVLAFEITNLSEINLNGLRRFFSEDDIKKAIRGLMRVNQDEIKRYVKGGNGDAYINGIRFYEDQQTRVR